MNPKLKKALCGVKCEINDTFKKEILCKIQEKERRLYKVKLGFFTLIGLSSIVIFVPVFNLLIKDFASSGIYEYLSVIFSNTGSVLSNSNEYFLVIAESLPIFSITLMLMTIFLFLISFKYTTKQIIRGQLLLTV